MYHVLCDNMVFEGNRLLIIDELLKWTELIAVETLKKRLQIINPKIERTGMDRDHLIKLKEKGIIEYGSLPIPRKNKPPESVDAVRIAVSIEALRHLLMEYPLPDIKKLYSSVCYQNMINYELIEKIKTEWDYPKNIDIEKGYRIRTRFNLINGENLGEKKEEINKDSVLSDEQVLELLSLSPSALRTLLSTEYKIEGLFGSVKADEKLESASFNEILILNMLLDLRRFGNLKKGTEIISDTQMKITLQIRTATEIINLLGKPEPNFVRVHHGRTMEEIKKLRSELKEKNTEYYKLSFGTGWF